MRESRSKIAIFCFVCVLTVILLNVRPAKCASTKQMDECGHTLNKTSTFLKLHVPYWKKFFTHLIPFRSSPRAKMKFYLYKRDFPECGREIRIDDNSESLEVSEFNAKHPTRIIIHGWMSQSRGGLSRSVTRAYLSLAKRPAAAANDTAASTDNDTKTQSAREQTHDDSAETEAVATAADDIDYNVIVVDWSVISSNVNYFEVVHLIEDLGFLLAEFVRYLHIHAQLQFDDVYLIGHSLGAQIAGSAGKQIAPFKFNTIFALDPAGPKFRNVSNDFRIDASDATYVESIHTSSVFGFREPVGHASFYPNYGKSQKNCHFYGCSHKRAPKFFAESITSERGFWGIPCHRSSNGSWILSDSDEEFRMGGEPSIPKNGTFYVKTNDKSPYAMGRRVPITMDDIADISKGSTEDDDDEEIEDDESDEK